MPYISGHHTIWYSPISGSGSASYVYLGSTREGVNHRERIHNQPVIDDSSGEAEVDGIQQGVDVTVDFDWVEYDLFKQCLYTTTGTGSQVTIGKMRTNVGKRLTDLGGILVLTPKPGTPAETEIGVGQSRIYYKAILSDDVEVGLRSKLRQGPARFKCFPDPTNSYTSWAIISTPGGVSGSIND